MTQLTEQQKPKWDKSGLKEACQRGLAIGRTHQEFDLQLLVDMLLEIERLESLLDSDSQAGWQPIDTAPKDSSWILAVVRTGRQVVIRWGGGTWEDDNRLCRDPIYWTPLRESPALERAAATDTRE